MTTATVTTKPQTLSFGTAKIGPAAWRNSTLNTIKESKSVIGRSDRFADFGKSRDPLPHLREVVAELSNNEAHFHFRQTRVVVARLREAVIETNEEIKTLIRAKEAVEKAQDNVKKDLDMNKACQDMRKSRPQREKEHDGADDLLKAERMHLMNQSKRLDRSLHIVKQQLQALSKCRQRLNNVLSERNRVLDLVCHAIPATGSQTARFSRHRSRPTPRVSMSADFERSGADSDQVADPLGAFTPEVESALEDAANQRQKSAMLRQELNDSVLGADNVQKSTLQSVNSGLTNKVAETVALKDELCSASSSNMNAINRAQRWYNTTEKSWMYSRGPLYYGDLSAKERLDRPVIKTFQRHPGTNVPEAQENIKATDALLKSLHETGQNIGLLKLAHLKLKDDIADKKAAIDIDSSIIRMRRKRADHRWVPGQAY